MSPEKNPKYLQQEESLAPQYKELISSLDRQNGWLHSNLYQYQGFWYAAPHLEAAITCHRNFQAQKSDVLLVTTPKSGTTWLKAILFALINRKRHPIAATCSHPLLTHNPHDLVPFLEIKFYAADQNPDIASFPSPRLFSTHMLYVSLLESVKIIPRCKLVCLCRNPKDTFVSLWHFTNKLRTPEMGTTDIGGVFDRFCDGISLFGPFWDHVLEYWRLSKERPDRVLFLKYEEIKACPGVHLRRLVEFLDCSFSTDEEESGMVEHILKLCSFDHLRSLGVNKNGKLSSGEENNALFCRGRDGEDQRRSFLPLTSAKMEKNRVLLSILEDESFLGSQQAQTARGSTRTEEQEGRRKPKTEEKKT